MSGRLANRNGERAVSVNGGRSRDRTYDLPIKSRLLYQLSYVPEKQEKNEGLRRLAVTPRNDW